MGLPREYYRDLQSAHIGVVLARFATTGAGRLTVALAKSKVAAPVSLGEGETVTVSVRPQDVLLTGQSLTLNAALEDGVHACLLTMTLEAVVGVTDGEAGWSIWNGPGATGSATRDGAERPRPRLLKFDRAAAVPAAERTEEEA